MTGKKQGRRYRLTEERIDYAVMIIETWQGHLTGEALAEKVSEDLQITVTRVGLLNKPRIRKAFEKRTDAQKSGKPIPDMDPTIRQWTAKVEALQAKLAARDEEIQQYKEKFITLHYNAKRLGMAVEDLEIPMPPRV